MQVANGRPIRTGISSLLSFSCSFSGDDYSIRSIGTRRVIYAIPFPRHKRNRFAEVRILSSRRFTRVLQILDQRIISSVEMCWCEVLSSCYPTFFDVRVAADLCRRRVLRDATTGGKQSRPSYFLDSPLFLKCSFFFHSRAFQPPFFALPSSRLRSAINRHDSRGTNAFFAICNVMCNT